ncbi:MAG: hypothetical protein AB4426_19290 [Xenococcaceae cyanobacterium]
MPKSIKIAPHLSVTKLQTRYRQSKDSVELMPSQFIWLLDVVKYELKDR